MGYSKITTMWFKKIINSLLNHINLFNFMFCILKSTSNLVYFYTSWRFLFCPKKMLLFISGVTLQFTSAFLLHFLVGTKFWSIRIFSAELSCQSRSWPVSVKLVAILTMTVYQFWIKRHFILSIYCRNMFVTEFWSDF